MERKLREGEIKTSVSGSDGCRRIISIEITPERFSDEREHVLKEFVREVSLPGFRKGKVPADVVSKRFAGEIRSEALKSILPAAYQHALEVENLDPVAEPEFRDIVAEEGKPVTFCVHLEVAPSLSVSDYRNLSVPAAEVSVTDEEVDSVVQNLLERQAEYVPVERGAVTTDIVVIEFAPLGADGAPDEKKRVRDYPVQLGAGQILPAFEEALAEKTPGSSGRATIAYPADYEPARLAGTTVEYEFSVKEVREKRVPALTDELAAKIDEKFKNLVDLKADVRARLLVEKEREARHEREERSVDILLERNPFDIPVSMRDRFKKELYEEDARRRRLAGVEPETDAERGKQLDELFNRVAERNIKRYFLLEHISGAAGISVSDDDIDAELARMAEASGRPLTEIKQYVYKDEERVSSLRNRLRERKIFEVILGGAGER